MSYCLNRDELKLILDIKIHGQENLSLMDERLQAILLDAEEWQDELCGLSYLFSKILLNSEKQNIDCQWLIDSFYSLTESMSFCTQGFDRKFIAYMLRSMRDSEIDLDENMVQIQKHLSQHTYNEDYGLRY